MSEINLQDIFIKKLKVKYLKKYIINQINMLKKLKKTYIQIGGNTANMHETQINTPYEMGNKEINTPYEKGSNTINTPYEKGDKEIDEGDDLNKPMRREGEQIRILGFSSFFQDAPNIISRSINIYLRIDTIMNQLKDISETYDESGNIKSILQLITNLTAAIKIFITLYGTVMKIFSGKWNQKIIDEIKEFERKMDKKRPPKQDEEHWKNFYSLIHEFSDNIKKSHEFSDNIKKSHPEMKVDSKILSGGGGDEDDSITISTIKDGESDTKSGEVSPQTAVELSALIIQTIKVLNEVTARSKIISTQIVPGVFEQYGNPFDKINKAITNAINIGIETVKMAIPGAAQIIAPLNILNDITKNADLILSMIEANLVLIEEVLKDNLEYDEKLKKWIVPLLEHSKVWLELAKNSPEVQKLLQAAANNIADNAINDTIKPSDEIFDSGTLSRALLRDLQRELNKSFEKTIAP